MPRREPRAILFLVLAAIALAVGISTIPTPATAPAPTPTPTPISSPPPSRIESPHPGLAVPTSLEDPSGHALDRFHEALLRTERGEEKTRVLFYGASHTAADHFPGQIRRALQERFGDGGRGFALPAAPSTLYDYWQWGATIGEGEGWDRVRLGLNRGAPDYYGIAGIIFDSKGREAEARVSNAESGVGSVADVVEVHYQAFPEGGVFDLWIDGEPRPAVDTAADEIGVGRVVHSVEEGSHEVLLRARPGASVRLYGFVFEREGPGVVVDNVALSGARARYHHKWLEPVYTEHLALRDPDLVVLWYGGNEGNDRLSPTDRTSWELRLTLAKLTEAVPDASCILVGAADKPLERDGGWVHRERTSAINRAMRTIAFAHGCAFFDTVAFMGGPLSMVRWVEADPTLARDDYIHFSALGYRLLSETILSEMLAGYDFSRRR